MIFIEKFWLSKIKLTQNALETLSMYTNINSSTRTKQKIPTDDSLLAKEELVNNHLMQRGGEDWTSGERKGDWYKVLPKGIELQDFINKGWGALCFSLEDSFIFQILLNCVIAIICFLFGLYSKQ